MNADNPGVNVENSNLSVRVEAGSTVVVMFCALLVVLAVLGAIIWYNAVELGKTQARAQQLDDSWRAGVQATRDDIQKLDRQFRMTELKLDDWTVVAHRAGLHLPSDYARGPQGNMDAESFNIKPKR